VEPSAQNHYFHSIELLLIKCLSVKWLLAKRCGTVSTESLVSFNRALVDQTPVDQMPVDQMPVDQMLVDQMPVGQVAFGQKMLNSQQRIISFIQSSSC
jgi:hypothetical protein